MFKSSLVVLALAIAGQANAQSCDSALNTQIAPMTFADAASAIQGGGSLVKDEFETTSQYEARLAEARQAMPTTMWVTIPINPTYVSYNADRAAFEIKSYALKNEQIDWRHILAGSPRLGLISPGSSNIDVQAGSAYAVTGTYTATNGFGAQWEVDRVDMTVEAIFDRAGSYLESVFKTPAPPSVLVWSIPVPADQARGYKERLRAAVRIVPRSPFYFEASRGSGAPITVQRPRDVTNITHVIVADIQCAIIIDDNNTVLISATTN
jgi:hypothetical protein